MLTKFRAYDTVTQWYGPIRENPEAARGDARHHNRGLRAVGGFGSAIVIQPDPEAPSRAVDLDGAPVWPPHGRSSGSVLFGEE